jgi:rhodanese-related sulfurtransferase
MKICATVCLFLLAVATASAADVAKITPKEADKLIKAGQAVLVDVREPSEWAKTGVAAPAVLLPKSDFDGKQKQWNAFLAGLGGKEVILYCHSGIRAGEVGRELAVQGFKVANAGGFAEWQDAGLPVRKVEAGH